MSEAKLIPQRLEREPYTITEAMKNAARERRGYGKPKNKTKKEKQ